MSTIKKLRETLKISQLELALILKLTPGAISQYESGIREPSVNVSRQIIALAKSHNIGLTLDDIYKKRSK